MKSTRQRISNASAFRPAGDGALAEVLTLMDTATTLVELASRKRGIPPGSADRLAMIAGRVRSERELMLRMKGYVDGGGDEDEEL